MYFFRRKIFFRHRGWGDQQAAYILGTQYYSKGHPEHVRWITHAAALGDSDGIYVLGMVYEYGWGVAVDRMLSAQLYRRAAL